MRRAAAAAMADARMVTDGLVCLCVVGVRSKLFGVQHNFWLRFGFWMSFLRIVWYVHMVLCRLRMVSYVNKYDVDVRKLVFVLWAVWAKIAGRTFVGIGIHTQWRTRWTKPRAVSTIHTLYFPIW